MFKSLVLSAFLIFSSYGYSQNYQPVEEGPIHEAFAERITGAVALDAVPVNPPTVVQERIPAQNDSQTVWIPGYWDWDADRQDFYWVTGTWRRPPPGRTWIPSLWLNSDEGWVRVHGFWSDVPESSLVYIEQSPPDDIDETVANPPGQNYFWLDGYWAFNASKNEYEWMEGQWQALDPNWIMVPAHYVWRPQGYVLVSAYWDWLLDDRGDAYSPIDIPEGRRENVVYAPVAILQSEVIIPRLFYSYPDYSSIYYHHHHYHPEYWNRFSGTPPWWGWSSWWSYSWSNSWGLWWWYTHPGYPHPHWMSSAMSQQFAPPHKDLLRKFDRRRGPIIVTPRGVVKPSKVLDALKKDDFQGKKGKFKPIVPSNKRDKLKLEGQIEPQKEPKVLLPSGKQGDKNRAPISKPILDSDVINKIPKGGKVVEPKTPKVNLPKREGGKNRDVNIPKDVKPPIKKPDQDKQNQGKDRGPKIINPNQPDQGDKNKDRRPIVIPPQQNKQQNNRDNRDNRDNRPAVKIPDQSPKRDRGDDGARIIIPPQQQPIRQDRVRDFQRDDDDRGSKSQWRGNQQDRGGRGNRGGDDDRGSKMRSGGDSQDRGGKNDRGGDRGDRGDRQDKDRN